MDVSIPEKVLRYETFINDVLKEDLKKVNQRQQQVNTEISEFLQLKNTIQTLADGQLGEGDLKTKMDIGCNFYVQANVSDTSKILINIGLGHYLEFALPDALKYVEKRVSLLTLQMEKLRKDSAHTKANIKLVLGGLEYLQNSHKK
uniref:Uncharacterized protein n=1 Tax=Timema cristinae TaxID=61476 RepID=A0A7R9D8E6_TIMCR|nr:unnamed protein product [Timema cristinae]